MHLGANASKPLSADVRLVGTLEAVHRFENNGARTVGQVVGLSGFDPPGIKYDRNWLRAGIGAEGKLGEGVGSLMLNATTKAKPPTHCWRQAGAWRSERDGRAQRNARRSVIEAGFWRQSSTATTVAMSLRTS